MNSFRWMVTFLLTVCIVMSSSSVAQAQGPPREECGQVATASGGTETSIQTCMNELLDEQLRMVDNIEEMEAEMLLIHMSMLGAKGTTANQNARLLTLMQGNNDDIQLLRDQLQRARQENSAVEDSDYDEAFEKADQQKGKNCKFSDMPFFESLDGAFPPGLKPFSGDTFDPKFGDGKCNVFKARIDDPGASDDGEVVRINERRENMCERVCDDRVNDSSVAGPGGGPPRPRKAERKERTVFALTDNIAAARRANEELEAGKATLSALRVQLAGNAFRIAGDEEDACEPVDVARGLDEAAEVVGLAKNAVAIVTAALELAKETARPPSKQDAAGFNASTAETPFSVAVGISKIVEQSLGFIEQGLKVGAIIAGRIQDFAQAQCLQDVQTQVADVKETVGETQEQIAELQDKVDDLSARLDEALELLRTPPGRRPGFPTKP